MEIDQIVLANLEQLWSKPEIRDAMKKVFIQSAAEKGINMNVKDLVDLFEQVDSFLHKDETNKKQMNPSR